MRLDVTLLSNVALADGQKGEAAAYAGVVVTEMLMNVDVLVSCGLLEESILSEHKKEPHLLLRPPCQALLKMFVVGYDLDAYHSDVLALAKQLEP
jgi:hypothetical protein